MFRVEIGLSVGVLILLAMLLFREEFGALEGRLFPVVETATIDRTEAVNATRTRIWGTSSRIRDCDFDGVDFYLGSPAKYSRVDLLIEEGSKQRPGGRFDFGPWVVQLSPDQFERAFAVVRHDCHPLWLTQTVFYP